MLRTDTTEIAIHRLTGASTVGRGYVVELYDLRDNAIEIRHCADLAGVQRAMAPYVADTRSAVIELLNSGPAQPASGPSLST